MWWSYGIWTIFERWALEYYICGAGVFMTRACKGIANILWKLMINWSKSMPMIKRAITLYYSTVHQGFMQRDTERGVVVVHTPDSRVPCCISKWANRKAFLSLFRSDTSVHTPKVLSLLVCFVLSPSIQSASFEDGSRIVGLTSLSLISSSKISQKMPAIGPQNVPPCCHV